MGRFINGVLVGVGVGLLVAPMTGKEMRRLIYRRYEQMSGYIPEMEQLRQASQQVATGFVQTANVVKDAAQQAANTVQATGNALTDLAQQTTEKVKQTGQNTLSATMQAAQGKDRGQIAVKSHERVDDANGFADDMEFGQGV